jgi:hypothetical protein
MGLSWLSTEARTGRILADLPLLAVQGAVKQTIGRYESITATLPINQKDAPPDWLRATKKNAAHIILTEDNPNDAAHGTPLIGYRINRRTRTHEDFITLDLMTIESYFDRRYIRGKTYTATGQNDIIADLINSYVLEGAGGLPGIPVRVQYVTAGTGALRDHTYADQDNKTVYSAMQDIMGVIGGAEWTTGWEWQSNPERLTPVAYVGDRIGSAAGALGPAATFEFPSKYGTGFELIEDYSVGAGANDAMAYSTGQGTSVNQSPHSTQFDVDMPTVEYRWTPSTTISDVTTLTTYAQNAVSTMFAGSTALSMSVFVDGAPKFGADWFLGDDIGYVLGGIVPDPTTKIAYDLFIDTFTDQFGASGAVLVNPFGVDSVPSVPGGLDGVARVAGWERTLDNTPIITPILVSSTGAFNA